MIHKYPGKSHLSFHKLMLSIQFLEMFGYFVHKTKLIHIDALLHNGSP